MSSVYWHQICSAERCCTATVESVTNAVTVFAREWVNKFCVAQGEKTGTKSHGNSTEPRRHYGTCSEEQSFICDFNLGIWNLEQILRNVKLIVYNGLNGNVGALVGPLFLAFWERAAVILSGLFCLKLLIKIRGQETILCPSGEYGELPENNSKKKEKKKVWLSWIPENVFPCLSNPHHLSRQ